MPTILFDATILVLLTFPALHAFAFAPLLRYLRAREAAEAQLQEAHRTLEQHAQELQRVNESLSAETAEHQRAAEDLHASEERLHAVLHSAHDAIISMDSNSRIISWNNGALPQIK